MIRPDWPAPSRVRAVATTRAGGVSAGPYASLNLGDHVGDAPAAVAENRGRLAQAAKLPGGPRWLSQVHGNRIVAAEGVGDEPVEADGAVTAEPGVVCAIMTADCLPLLLCDRQGRSVGAVHCGWRGLAAGIVGAAVEAFANRGIAAGALRAWLGPAISAAAYEVGDDVREAFTTPADAQAFVPNARGRWQLDLYRLATGRLHDCGVTSVHGGGFCTAGSPRMFFSHRRDGSCGRQATLIWLE